MKLYPFKKINSINKFENIKKILHKREISNDIHNSKQKVYLHQKFINSRKNQKIELNFEECERLMNLLSIYVFKGDYKYSKDKVIIYREGNQTEK